MEAIRMVAMQAIRDLGDTPTEAYISSIEHDTHVTAKFWVMVKTNEGSYEVPVAARVEYTHPVAVEA